MPIQAKRTSAKHASGAYAIWEKWARDGVPARQKTANWNFENTGKLPVSVRNERETRFLYYFALATKALGDKKLAEKFMTRKHPKLGVAPIKKLDTEWGGREVEQILNSIIYGLPA